MNRIIFESTSETPEVIIDPANGTINISGDSHPENTKVFYEPIISHAKDLIADTDKEIILVKIHFRYLNSASSKYIREFVIAIDETADENKKKAHIQWMYDEDDIDMEEQGEDIFEGINCKTELIEA